MRIKALKSKKTESYSFENVMIKTINIEGDPLALKNGKESFSIKIAYQFYAISKSGQIIFDGRAKRIEFKDSMQGKAGFMNTLNKAIAKKIKSMHGLEIQIK